MLKSDFEFMRQKNEEYIIKLADINSLYQEACDRNRMLEKICKRNTDQKLEEEFSSQKSSR